MRVPLKTYPKMPEQMPYSLGFSRYALNFDGTDDYVEVPDDPSLEGFTNGVTVCAWVKPNFTVGTTTDYGWILENNRYQLLANGNWGFGINVQNASGTWSAWAGENSTFTAGNWYFVVGRYDPSISEVRLFVNATPYSAESLTGDVYSSTDNHRIGINLDGTNPFDGDISMVMIYGRALTQREIRYNMLNYHTPIMDGIRLLMRLEEGAGTTAEDSSGNNNDGDLLPAADPRPGQKTENGSYE